MGFFSLAYDGVDFSVLYLVISMSCVKTMEMICFYIFVSSTYENLLTKHYLSKICNYAREKKIYLRGSILCITANPEIVVDNALPNS